MVGWRRSCSAFIWLPGRLTTGKSVMLLVLLWWLIPVELAERWWRLRWTTLSDPHDNLNASTKSSSENLHGF